MMRYFLLSKETNRLLNVVVWDGVSQYNPGDKYYLLPEESGVQVGWVKTENGWIEVTNGNN